VSECPSFSFFEHFLTHFMFLFTCWPVTGRSTQEIRCFLIYCTSINVPSVTIKKMFDDVLVTKVSPLYQLPVFVLLPCLHLVRMAKNSLRHACTATFSVRAPKSCGAPTHLLAWLLFIHVILLVLFCTCLM